jgi:hypothetical protein
LTRSPHGPAATGRIVAPMTKATMAMAGLLIVGLTGCGSSGGATGTGGSGATGTGGAGGHLATGGQGGAAGGTCAPLTGEAGTSSGTMSWKSNGTTECAGLSIVGRTIATLADTIEIDTPSADGMATLDIVLSSYSGPLGGTYSCEPGNGTTAPYVALAAGDVKAGGSTTSDCTVTISFSQDSAGIQHAQGTFSGTTTGDGGADVVTDGTFDLTVMLTGG